jgi:hypothetical protein
VLWRQDQYHFDEDFQVYRKLEEIEGRQKPNAVGVVGIEDGESLESVSVSVNVNGHVCLRSFECAHHYRYSDDLWIMVVESDL